MWASGAVRWLAATPRRNALAGGAALLAAVGLFALLDAVAGGGLGFVLALAGTSVLVLVGLVLLAQPARLGVRGASAVGAGLYLLVAVILFATGIPVYGIEAGTAYLLVLWPTYVIWLHACLLGVGLWACPLG